MLRYDETILLVTDLDPIEDILNFITALKSKGFASNLLREKHGFTNSTEINKTTKLISLHVENAIGLANQGFAGPPQNSFLPLYYSTLNLIKVYLLFLGKRSALEKNRWHGAKYSEREMAKQFLNEKIHIHNRGTIPLIYSTLMGKSIAKSGLDITIREIYKNISSISAEYTTITKEQIGLLAHTTKIIRDDTNGHYLELKILEKYFIKSPPAVRTLKAYPRLRIVNDGNGNFHYTSNRVKGNYDLVKKNLELNVKRYLNSDECNNSMWYSYTPISGRNHILNEEISIMLAYFHLCNVVRYNPEHLDKLMDSKYWAIMLGLKKHGFLRFLKLMWGNYIKKSFDIT